MNWQLILSTSSSIFTLLFINMFLLPISYCQDDDNFGRCFSPFNCGDIENLSFPFWKDDGPQLCHQLGFRLTKCEDPQPVIIIGGYEFRLIYLNYSTYTMTVARNDLWDQLCTPSLINVTLGRPFLSYPQTNRNLNLFYDCTLPLHPNQFECPGRGLYSFYEDDVLERAAYEELSGVCVTAIRVQVNQSAFAQLQNQNQSPQLLEAWRLGFDVKYNYTAIFCEKCNSLKGKCANLTSPTYPFCSYRESGMHNLLNPTLRKAYMQHIFLFID
ncbi:hypothetical protein PTKIN_Ptkin04bG0109800 [Pterospermum kingtungense]